MNRFDSKVVLVTGAASGIGRAAAELFSREGAAVVLADRAEAVHAVAATLPAERTTALTVDLADPAAPAAMVRDAVGWRGRLDVLVNNAGIAGRGRPEDIGADQWRQVMAIDLDAVFFASQAAIPALEASGGSIVTTASLSGLGGDWNRTPYNAAKGAVVNLTRALALDLGGRGIRVNAVAPSITRSGLTDALMEDEARLATFMARVPLGRVCEPEEVAAAILFLASAEASFITGVILPVDGGVSASNGQPSLA